MALVSSPKTTPSIVGLENDGCVTGSARRSNGIVATVFVIFFLVICALIAQPTMIRPGGLPLALTLIVFLNLYWITFGYRGDILIWTTILGLTTFLIFTDILFAVGLRGTILGTLMLFTFFSRSFGLTLRQSDLLWRALAIVCAILAVIGLVRYFTGYAAPMSENTDGIENLGERYFYLGIAYLPSTRNSDSLYFIAGLVSALVQASRNNRLAPVFLIMAILQAVVIALSLSRGAYLAGLVGAILLIRPKQTIYASLMGFVFLILLVALAPHYLTNLSSRMDFFWDLASNAVLSLLDVEAANQNLSSIYNYSNDDRVELYLRSIELFLRWPFGQGMDNPFLGSANRIRRYFILRTFF